MPEPRIINVKPGDLWVEKHGTDSASVILRSSSVKMTREELWDLRDALQEIGQEMIHEELDQKTVEAQAAEAQWEATGNAIERLGNEMVEQYGTMRRDGRCVHGDYPPCSQCIAEKLDRR